ncbi:tripartite motif-containing protein 16-like isoform X1 [Erpetoichthys calabaricus]|uniref:Tripartite motif-containing protein 16-like n=1 Tax=Erpetoichthys calabaricus TaxID=27687 RepID=A0A8C4SY02_ERPCA|nr:tripartite motif-containing protein 16-like isoform X1 [Erpetoichthys calabaricus]
MAEAHLFELQDEITCSLCQDILSDPVLIPCGHNFCLKCLTDCWDQSQVCSCPQCRHTFTTRPELNRNPLLNEVIQKLKKMGLSHPQSQNYAGPGDVECDFCTGKKLRAVKSCLTCMISFCQTHLQPHYEVAVWKDHKLTDPDGNLKEKFCAKHQKVLEIFCKTDGMCICLVCGENEHEGHEKMELARERKEKEKQLGATLSEIKKRLEEREKTLEETRRAMEQMKVSVGRELEENEKSFTDLIHCIEEAYRKVTERIREQEKREMENAEGVMERLDKEIEELKRRDAELMELLETKDHIHFLQNFSSRCVLPDEGDTLSFTVTADFSCEELRKELACLKKSLEKISRWNIKTLTSGREAPAYPLQYPEPYSREDFLQYFCPLTLDINTANEWLSLSEGDKKVTRDGTKHKYPDHPYRLDSLQQVLCREALTGSRFYWEVEWSGSQVAIGVAYIGLNRKAWERDSGLGINDKSWSLRCSYSQYIVCHNSQMNVIQAPCGTRIGVYLDWPAGSLTFYSVSHTMTILHRFNTTFTEPLYPGFGFWLSPNSSVKICHLTPGDQ